MPKRLFRLLCFRLFGFQLRFDRCAAGGLDIDFALYLVRFATAGERADKGEATDYGQEAFH